MSLELLLLPRCKEEREVEVEARPLFLGLRAPLSLRSTLGNKAVKRLK